MADPTAASALPVATVDRLNLLLTIAKQADVAALVRDLTAALDAALKMHEPVKLYERAFDWTREKSRCGHDPDADGWDDTHMETVDHGWVCLAKPVGTVCSTCTEDDVPSPWPCPEYEAVTAALSGSRETPSTAGTTVEEAMSDD